MGLSPAEFAEYTPAQFMLKSIGFQNAKDRQESIFRRMTGFIIAPHLSKKAKFKIETEWPILSDKNKKEYRTEAMFSKEKIKTMLDLIAKDKK